MVQRAMMNWRLVKRESTGTLYRWGNIDRTTFGMVSPEDGQLLTNW